MDAMVTTAVAAAGTVAGYAGQRALDFAVDKLATAIIRPCAERRAHAYFRQLAEAVVDADAGEVDAERIAAALDAVTKDEPARETVFEFYRQSVLSRSKEVGPRLLALIAARLIKERRTPSDGERQIAEIAEACTDDDFSAFTNYYQSLSTGSDPKQAERVKKTPGGFLVRLDRETSDSNWPSPMRSGPLNLGSALGPWAAKFERIGAIEQHIETSSKEYKEDSERHIDMDGVLTITEWSLFLGETCDELSRLLPLASPTNPVPAAP